MLHSRHFTLDQANALLPFVGSLVRDIRDARERLVGNPADGDFALLAEATGGAWPGRERAADTVAIALGFEQLEDLDVLVRDLDRGVVDFPALMDGREVYLCWHVGEPDVGHWHEIESGFAGRRPLGREARRF